MVLFFPRLTKEFYQIWGHESLICRHNYTPSSTELDVYRNDIVSQFADQSNKNSFSTLF